MEYCCKDVSKEYSRFRKNKGKVGIEDVSLVLKKGDIIGIVGLTRSGKSALIDVLSGKTNPSKGRLNYNAKEISRVYYEDSVKLNRGMTVYDNMVYFGKKEKMSELDVENRMAQLRDIFDLQKYINTRVEELSDANRVKSELAMLLLNSPRIIFIDDAFNFLKNTDRNDVLKCLKRLNKQERTIIVISAHTISDVDKIISRIILVDKSKLVYDSDIASFKEKYSTKKIIEIELNKNVSLSKLDDIEVLENSDYYYKLSFPNKTGMFASIINQFDVNNIVDLKVGELPLMDVLKQIKRDEKDV